MYICIIWSFYIELDIPESNLMIQHFFNFGMPYLSYHMILSKTVFQEDTELGIQKFLIFIILV